MRVGFGYDIHALVPGRPLVIGGITLPFEYGLDGHSDADVLTHALIDAMLGAAAMGDIGTLFPDTEERYRGISSLRLLKTVLNTMNKAGYQIHNIDATIIAQAPKLGPHRDRIIRTLADAMGIPVNRVSVKATTHEGFDATGRGEAIAAYAVVCLSGGDG
ncbi:MAG TPA: 2-C-methyl-D-erythritol 2,4-cyclodiphosphate synthase [bacterium]|nr:2-C-methyl-D-erythritol 2,4-cyclodiphosphate synthase [bacterium]